jgi:hypothetical protein
MSIEINRVRLVNGEVRAEFVFPNIGSFTRGANELLRIEGEAFAPVEPIAPAQYYDDTMARLRMAAEREAKREAAQTATGRSIPRAYVAGQFDQIPEDTTFGGQPLPVLMADGEEPPLRANHEYEPHELKVGGTD